MSIKKNIHIIQHTSGSVDVSDYVFQCDDVPINFERNSNWEPIISTFKFSLSQDAPITPTTPSVYDSTLNDVVVIYINDDLKFTGYIESFSTDYANHSFTCNVCSKFRLLQNKRLERGYGMEQIYDVYSNTTNLNEYNPDDTWSWYNGSNWVDYQHLRSVQLLWFMKALFGVCDMTLDTTSVDDLVIARITGGTRLDPTSVDIKASDVVLDEAAIWTINQSIAADYNQISSYHSDSKISMFDFIRISCGYFGFVIVPTNINTYKLYYKDNLATLDFATITSKSKYSKNTNNPKYDNLSNDYKYTRRDLYYTVHTTDENPLDIPNDSDTTRKAVNYMGALKSPYTVHWFNNLWFMTRSSTITGRCEPTFGMWGLAAYQSKTLNTEFTDFAIVNDVTETVETPVITDTYNLLSNKLNISSNRSIIVKSELGVLPVGH